METEGFAATWKKVFQSYKWQKIVDVVVMAIDDGDASLVEGRSDNTLDLIEEGGGGLDYNSFPHITYISTLIFTFPLPSARCAYNN